MGYDLSNSSGASVRFKGAGWDLVLAVAQHYGWEPAGIPKPASWDEERDGPWEDEYWINAGQEVTAPDAAMLTTALDRAVAAPDLIETIIRIKDEMNKEAAAYNPKWRDRLKPLTHDEAEGFRARLIELAALTRQGPFIIE
jgi:hypothetical protein